MLTGTVSELSNRRYNAQRRASHFAKGSDTPRFVKSLQLCRLSVCCAYQLGNNAILAIVFKGT